MVTRVEQVYANAFFEVAKSNDNVEKYYQELNYIKDAFLKNNDLLKILGLPSLKKEKKKEIITNIFSSSLSDETLNFLNVIIDKKRGSKLIGIIDTYFKIRDDFNNVIDALIKSASPLSDNQRDRAKKILEEITNKEIRLKEEVQNDLLGGLWVKVGDKIVDLTVKEDLRQLKKLVEQTIV